MHVTRDELAALENLARQTAANAYAPFSNFFVGAALLLASGEMVGGCNVENSSFRLTVCAEQNAIACAIGRFGPQIRLRAVVVINRANLACSPCGACRQTILEFSSPQTFVSFPGDNGEVIETTIAALLPHAFSRATSL